MKTIPIAISYEEIQARQRRCEAANLRQPHDRVPVLFYIGSRYWLPLIGYADRFGDYANDPKTMLECQLMGQKWILENVKSDFHRIVLYPDFMWVEDADAFGAKTMFQTSDSPWVARPHLLQNDDDLEPLRKVDYVHNGLHGKMLNYYQQMKEIGAEYEIEFSDGQKISAADCVYPGGAGILGIAGLASDLCGVEKFSMALYQQPEFIKELLGIIVDKSIDWIDAVFALSKGDAAFCADLYQNLIHVGDDAMAQMSPAQVAEFMAEPHKRLADHIRALGCQVQAHNCGRADHLLDFWADEVRIDRYLGFSYLTDKQALRDKMGRRIVIMGGLDTVKLHGGTPQEVAEDCRMNLEIFKECPGYFLMDGHNVAPDSPVENLNAVMETAMKYGCFD